MKFTISTLEEPFAFFEDYIRLGGIRKHLDEYIKKWSRAKRANPSSIEFKILDNDCDVRYMAQAFDLPVDGSTDDGTIWESLDEESFSDISKHQLSKEIEISKRLIKKSYQEYLGKFNDSSNIVSFHAKSLKELISESEYILTNFPFCLDYLNKLSQYIQDLSCQNLSIKSDFNSKPSFKRDPFISKNKSPNDDEYIRYSFFAASDVKMSFLKWLYERFCENFIIEELGDYSEGEERFIDIFSSSRPMDLGYSIQFKINNIEVAYIIKALQPYFKNLNPTSIGQSKCFLKDESKKAFNRDDLYPAKSKLEKGLISKRITIKNDVKIIVREIEDYQDTAKKGKNLSSK